VKSGECFSLLGINGAGKTSTFNCLVGEEDVSGGSVYLAGININTMYKKPHLLYDIAGYCPQFNCIDESLTVKQTLTLYARLVGIDEEQVSMAVMSYIVKFGLVMFVDTQAGSLSGGNKRKLCLAMAMIGQPKVIYIDEASAGVDPGSRRIMWKAIRSEGANSAVVITTHAMEEAEALSSKLGIMVAGKFKCLGTLQHIKNAYGQGFEIEINLDIEELLNEIGDSEPE
jgi:ATP-binding cassette subfamily A (ABC1) protein 3